MVGKNRQMHRAVSTDQNPPTTVMGDVPFRLDAPPTSAYKAGRGEVMKVIGKSSTLEALQEEMMPARGARFKVWRGGPIWGRHKADGAAVTYPLPGCPFSGPHQSDESRSGIRIRQSTPSRWRSDPGLHTPWRRPGIRCNLPLGSGWVDLFPRGTRHAARRQCNPPGRNPRTRRTRCRILSQRRSV